MAGKEGNVNCVILLAQNEDMEVVDNTEMRHFEYREGEKLAVIEYQIQEKKYFLTRVDFPNNFEDSGEADQMMEAVIEIIEESGLRVVPMTRFVKNFFKRNRQHKHLLPVGIHL